MRTSFVFVSRTINVNTKSFLRLTLAMHRQLLNGRNDGTTFRTKSIKYIFRAEKWNESEVEAKAKYVESSGRQFPFNSLQRINEQKETLCTQTQWQMIVAAATAVAEFLSSPNIKQIKNVKIRTQMDLGYVVTMSNERAFFPLTSRVCFEAKCFMRRQSKIFRIGWNGCG